MSQYASFVPGNITPVAKRNLAHSSSSASKPKHQDDKLMKQKSHQKPKGIPKLRTRHTSVNLAHPFIYSFIPLLLSLLPPSLKQPCKTPRKASNPCTPPKLANSYNPRFHPSIAEYVKDKMSRKYPTLPILARLGHLHNNALFAIFLPRSNNPAVPSTRSRRVPRMSRMRHALP